MALPNGVDRPAHPFVYGDYLCVTLNHALQLWDPIFLPRPWQSTLLALVMLVPEATMDEYDLPPTGNRNVGGAGKIADVLPETVPLPM
jgi:hypothetical protein